MKELLKGEIVDNPDTIKKNFIDGEIIPEVAKTEGKDREINIVRQIRDKYRKLIVEQKQKRETDLTASRKLGMKRRSVDFLLTEDNDNSRLRLPILQ